MMESPVPRQFLRRKDARRRLKCAAAVECHGITRRMEVVDFSSAGLRLDNVTGLAAGDQVLIAFSPTLAAEGTVIWSVWHKAGVKLSAPLEETDSLYMYLSDQADTLERTRKKAVFAVAQEHAAKARASGTD
jgi:hypothetical protein